MVQGEVRNLLSTSGCWICVPLNIFELNSGTQLNYLETFEAFGSSVVRQDPHRAWLRASVAAVLREQRRSPLRAPRVVSTSYSAPSASAESLSV